MTKIQTLRWPVVAVVVVLTLSACGWTQWRGDAAHTGYQAGETKITTGNVAQLKPAWMAKLSGLFGAVTSSPVSRPEARTCSSPSTTAACSTRTCE